MIKAAHHVQISIPVGAEDEARKFYCGLLGMTEIPKPDSLCGRGGFWLDLDGFQIHFGVEDGVERQKTKGHVAYARCKWTNRCRRHPNPALSPV